MPVNFGGKWILAETDNYEQFIIDMNVPEPMRKMLMAKAELEIVHDGNTVKYRRKKGDDVLELVFTIGEKFTENAYGYKEVRVCNWEGDKMVANAAEGESHWTSTVEIIGGRLVATDVSAGGVLGKRIFDRV
ncbi:fatty acid-binding protein, liver-like [Amphiura filiformis]|uniref:fatty acid-binding protein, liver-like n=1 Tax=Amphiura filiformis TaxID=82378 RepID=UPI003B21E8D1